MAGSLHPGTLRTQVQGWPGEGGASPHSAAALSGELPTSLRGALNAPSRAIWRRSGPQPSGGGGAGSTGHVARPGGQVSVQSGLWPGGRSRGVLGGWGAEGGWGETGQRLAPGTQAAPRRSKDRVPGREVRVPGGQAAPGWCLQGELPTCLALCHLWGWVPGQGQGPPRPPVCGPSPEKRQRNRGTVDPSCGGDRLG